MLLALFLIIFSAIALRNIRYGVYLIIFSMPLYLWRFSVFGIPSTALEAMIYILFLIWALNKIKIPPFVKGGLRGISSFIPRFALKQFYLLGIGIILLFLGVIISTSISSDPKTSLGILKGWFFDPFLFFIILVNAIKKENEVKNLFYSFALSGLAVSFAAIFYWIIPAVLNGVTYDGRLRAFYLSPNHLAMYLAPALIIIFNFQFSPLAGGFNKFSISQINRQIIFILAFLAVLTPFLLTYSYSAWFGAVIAMIFLLIANRWLFAMDKNKLLGWLIAILAIATMIFSRANAYKFQNILNFSYPSISSRLVIWKAAADILKEHWIFGIGPGAFQDYYLKFQSKYPPYPEWAVPQPHNIFLAFWLQTGLLGLIGFLLILIWFFKVFFLYLKDYKANRFQVFPNDKPAGQAGFRLCVICVSIMIYMLVHGLFDTTYWKNDLAMIFWLLIGIMYAVQRKED